MTSTTSSPQTLDEVISVEDRFHRSINLKQDWNDGSALDHYILTPTAQELTDQILDELTDENGTRAWSITGPYGTGKSAFALFLTELLASTDPDHSEAQTLREDYLKQDSKFLPLLIVSDRSPLEERIVKAVLESFEGIDDEVVNQAQELIEQENITGDDLSDLLEQASQAAEENGQSGVVLIVDEFGKFLEFAAEKPEERDLLFLQTIAETASRSEVPLLFITLLHMGFADYLPIEDELHRKEWQKIQGRFRDVAFQLPTEQLLNLVSKAITSGIDNGLKDGWEEKVHTIWEHESLSEVRGRMSVRQILSDCFPLHPISSLLLWPIFRSKLAQNERSLFMFLTSKERFGFRDHLQQTDYDSEGMPELYTVDHLFDYVNNTLALGTFRGQQGRQWAQIKDALNRLPSNAPPASESMVKAIGLISMYGSQVGFEADEEILSLALDMNIERVEETLGYLEEQSLVIYRNYKSAYSLWEGSDVDLTDCYEEAKKQIASRDLSKRIVNQLDLRPFVARAHYIETGTLRYFEVEVCGPYIEEVQEAFEEDESDADGKIVFVVGDVTQSFVAKIEGELNDSQEEDSLELVAFPGEFTGLSQALKELESWQWVQDNVTELRNDQVARDEVRSRISHARDEVERIAGEIFGIAGHTFRPDRSAWIHSGGEEDFDTPKEFQRWLSNLCDDVFHAAPKVHNELVNRQSPSSTSVAARKKLITAMYKNPHEEQLGIEGTPAEASMYKSVLQAGGFHQETEDGWELSEPDENWDAVWECINEFIGQTRNQRRTIEDLFEVLQQPPLGLREGIIPIVFMAYALLHWDELGFYEDGVYVPEVGIETIERLLKRPDTFEVQTYSLDEEQRKILKVLSEKSIQGPNQKAPEEDLLPIVKSLVKQAADINAYTKQTSELNPPEAIEVRDALLEATSPKDLLFEELPRILEADVSESGGVEDFATQIRECMQAIHRAYPALLDKIENGICRAFDLPQDGPAVKAVAQLRQRSKPLVDYALEDDLQVFVREASRLNNQRDWREVLGRVINPEGMPPSDWTDRDVSNFHVNLQKLSSSFHRLEELVAEQADTQAERIMRLGILGDSYDERRAIVALDQDIQDDVSDLQNRIQELLTETNGMNGNRKRVGIAALAEAASELLDTQEE